MTTINLFLDDLRPCPPNFTLARTYHEAIELFHTHHVNILSLDHDLGCDELGRLLETGYDFVKWFVDSGYSCNEIRFHTANPIGKQNMVGYLLSAQRCEVISEDIKIVY